MNGLVLVAVAVVAVLAGGFAVARRGRQATALDGALRRQLPDVLEVLAAAVDAGVPVMRAIDVGARHVRGELGPLLAEAATTAAAPAGPPLGRALAEIAPCLREFGALVDASERLGGPLAEPLRLLARSERDRQRVAARERAARASTLAAVIVGALLAPAALTWILGAEALAVFEAVGAP